MSRPEASPLRVVSRLRLPIIRSFCSQRFYGIEAPVSAARLLLSTLATVDQTVPGLYRGQMQS
jgi:hypothetical protein